MAKTNVVLQLNNEEKKAMLFFLCKEYAGTFFSAKAVKRGDGSLRWFKGARQGVTKYLQGGERKYDSASYGLVPIWESQSAKQMGGDKAYRQIATEGVQEISIGGMTVKFQ